MKNFDFKNNSLSPVPVEGSLLSNLTYFAGKLSFRNADQLQAITTKLGLVKFADVNVPFDPMIHEALTHSTSADVKETTATQVLQPGYKFKEKVIRPARVAVTDPIG